MIRLGIFRLPNSTAAGLLAAFLLSLFGFASQVTSAEHDAPLVLPDYSAESLAMAEKNAESFVLVATKPGCPVCARQVPAISEALGDSRLAELKIMQYDQTKEDELNHRLEVFSQSTIIVFRDGKEVSRSIGLTNPDSILAELLLAVQ
nr:thioredoxin family protein [Halomonas socia]